jgi:hypothetical protein
MTVIWFVCIGIVGTAALALISLTGWRWWLRALIALGTTTLIGLLLTPGGPALLGAEDRWFNTSPFRELILFSLMLVGMIARVLSVAIENRGRNNNKGVVVDRWDFVYPMLFAVPTFGALLSQTHSETLALTNVILAFQTGFFWQTILKKGETS